MTEYVEGTGLPSVDAPGEGSAAVSVELRASGVATASRGDRRDHVGVILLAGVVAAYAIVGIAIYLAWTSLT